MAAPIPRAAAMERALRRRLDHWHLDVLPGHRCRKILFNMQRIRQLVPPRVLSVVLRSNLNGWMTARRFQGTGRCVMGCGRAVDSLKHYCHCPVYHGLCWQHLRLERPEAAVAMSDFLLISPSSRQWRVDGPPQGGPAAAALRALSVFALYSTHNAVRHGGDGERCAELFRGFLREGARGHGPAAAVVSAAHKRRRRE